MWTYNKDMTHGHPWLVRVEPAPTDYLEFRKIAEAITWISGVDVAEPSAGETIVEGLKGDRIDTVVITAGYFSTETLEEPNWDDEVKMYKTSSIGPVFIVHALVKHNLLPEGSKVILVSSESGSITLRHESEGGGNYGHHASKAALNMVGKLLSLDLKDKKVAVAITHPAFMRSEMTKGQVAATRAKRSLEC